jgi:hypothetical protein
MKYLRLLTGHQDPKLSKIELFYSKKNAEGSAKEFNDEIIEDEYDGNEDAWLNDGNAQACSVVSLDIQFPTPDYGVKEYFFTFRAVIDGVDYEGQCHSDLFCGVDFKNCGHDGVMLSDVNDELAQLVGWDGVLELIEYAHAQWENEPPAKEKKRHVDLLANAWPRSSKHKPKQTH